MRTTTGAGRAGSRWGVRIGALALLAALAVAAGTVDGGGSAQAASTPGAALALQKGEPLLRVEPQVLRDIAAGGGEATFWVMLREQADLSAAKEIVGRGARGVHVYRQLTRTAERSQASLRSFLRSRKAAFRPFWVVNAIRVTGDLELARDLAARPDVRLVFAEKVYELPTPTPAAEEPRINGVEWGIDRINAPDVWAQGFTGTGIVVGVIDSGVQFNHPALVGRYRGNLGGGSFDHNYSWHDPSSVCGSPSLVPCDNNGHGTHVTGTILGDDGGANQIGVAPGARWIAAKGCETNNCSDFALLSAGQWMLAPTQLNGSNPDPSKRPHIVNNSWGGGANSDPWYQSLLQSWVAAGMFPQFANGNAGPGCGTAGNPGNTPEAYAAGAFDVNNVIASFSSRGASAFGGIVKPNLSAPGVAIRSSVPGNGYSAFNGTSMASPHVAGAIALLWEASPLLRGDVAATKSLLDGTAIDVSDLTCGGTAGNNNVWGEGRLDVLAAYDAAPLGDVGTLGGTVTDGGSPLAGAKVTAVGPVTRTATTNASGVYSMPLTPGSYTVTAAEYAYVSQSTSASITQGVTTTRDFALSIAPTHTLSGVVRNDKGQPLAGARVKVVGTPLAEVSSDGAGNYAVPGVPQGTYDVRATAGCHQPSTQGVAVSAATTRDFALLRREDAFGHTCSLPAVPFEEAATVLPIAGDEVTGAVALPFAFPFYGATYSSVNVYTNGVVGFAAIPANHPDGWTNRALPDTTAPNAAIYPFWDDLVVDASASIRGELKGTAPDRRYVIEFRNPRFWDPGASTKRVDFNVVLYESGDILMQYRNLAADALEQGSSATIGIEGAAGTDALQYSFNEPVLTSGTSILFVPPRLPDAVPERPAPGSGSPPAPPPPPVPPRSEPGPGPPPTSPPPPVPSRP